MGGSLKSRIMFIMSNKISTELSAQPQAMPYLGTPLSPHATRVMLLGAGELGKEVIIALQRLGVETIAVDRYPNAPGHQVAHRSHVINMTDPAALRALVEAERPHVIVPEIEAIATAELLRIERDALARVTPTALAAHLTMNREGIRRLAAEDLGLRTSPYRFADSLPQLQEAVRSAIGLPCVVKPVMSSSGKGQSKVDRFEDLEAAWEYARAAARVGLGRVIVEGFVDFEYEITQLTVRYRQADGATTTAYCEPIGHVQVHGDYVESWQPHPMPEPALRTARDYARRVTEALGGWGIFGVELFVRGEQVWFSEVSPRPHDTGLVTLATQWQSEFDLHARALLGLPVDATLRNCGASAVIYGGLEAAGIVYEGVETALSVPGTDLRLFGKPESFARRRMGVVVARADEVGQARAKAKQAAGRVRPRRISEV